MHNCLQLDKAFPRPVDILDALSLELLLYAVHNILAPNKLFHFFGINTFFNSLHPPKNLIQ